MKKLDREKKISISIKDAKKIASVLESVVVSMDRIGSVIAIHKLSATMERKIMHQYYADFNVFSNLSKARRIIWEAIDQVLPGKFENGIRGTKYWEYKMTNEKYLNKKK